MPELPEVETIRQGLLPVLVGQRIAWVRLRRKALRWPFPENLAERLTDACVRSVSRRAKFLLITLDRGETLLMHFGMSGRVVVVPAASVQGQSPGVFYHSAPRTVAHDHLILGLQSGATVVLNDPRRFGAVDLAPTDAVSEHPWLAGLGPEPFDEAFSQAYLADVFRSRHAPVKTLLLDQRIVAGLGNIYATEALFRAGIHPARPGGSIGRVRLSRLVQAIRSVLSEAIAAGGSSLRDYAQADGTLGYFQHAFQVYDREGGACLRPGCRGTIARIVQAGRSTWYCPKCQR